MLYTIEQIRQAVATAHGDYKAESELDELLEKLTHELDKCPKQYTFTHGQVETALYNSLEAVEAGSEDFIEAFRNEIQKQLSANDTRTPKQRAEFELYELELRLSKLEAFIGDYHANQPQDTTFWKLPADQRGLLLIQRTCMQDYAKVLRDRLKIWSDK